MPYIGNTIRAADDYRLIDDISSGFNGSETSFALQVAGSAPVPFPKSPQQILISVNGVIQEPDPTGSSGFNLVGTNIVFSSAPTNGHAFFGIIYATADYLNAGGNFPSGSTGSPSLTFIGDEDTGIYRKGSGSVGFVSNSTEIANTDSNGITISSGNLILGDSSGATSDRIVVGAGSDLSIYHDSSSTYISNNNAGSFFIQGLGNIVLEEVDGTNHIRCVAGGETQIHHNGSIKFETSSTGAKVTGDLTIAEKIIHDSDTNTFMSFPSNDSIGFTTAGSTRMTIDSDGDVGIGTTTPDINLTIVGSNEEDLLQLSTGNAGGNTFAGMRGDNEAGIRIRGGGSGRGGEIELAGGGRNTDPAVIKFSTTTGTSFTERMRIDASGTVKLYQTDSLIHTNSNSSRLRLFGGSAASVSDGAALTLHGVSHSSGNYADLAAATSGRIQFRVGTSEHMRITSEGRVGIKTTAPDATLHLGGPISSHPVLLLEGGGSATGDLTVPHDEHLQIGHWNSSSDTYTNRLQVHVNGNVTKPSQACMVFVDPTNRNISDSDNDDPLHFDNQHINQGSMASSNTKSRITVPTTGIYLINVMLSGSLTTASAGDGIQIMLKRNGSNYPDQDAMPAEGMGVTSGEEYAFTLDLPISLNANDYVEVAFANVGASIAFSCNRGYFGVTLLS